MSAEKDRFSATKQITLIGAGVNAVLALAKVVLGSIGHSQALVADGIHSLSDLASDALVLYAASHGSRSADEEHPYGHARIETLGAVAMGALLIAVALGILYDAIHRLFEPDLLMHPGWLALSVAFVSIISKEVLYQYTMVVARRLRSPLLKANAWHHRSDAISSIVVLVGVAGSMAGLTYLDAIGAVVVAVMIAHVGWGLAYNALTELVDTGLSHSRLQSIREAILAVRGVQGLHKLRTRRMGEEALVDVHIILANPRMSVSEGHQISETVRQRLIREMDEVSDVTVHIDPEDDSEVASCRDLPLRDQIEQQLHAAWTDVAEARQIDALVLHYIAGKVDVDVFLPLSLAQGPDYSEALTAKFRAPLAEHALIGTVRLCFC